MACIADQKNAALAPPLPEHGMEPVDGRAPDLHACRIDEPCDLGNYILGAAEGFRVFAWQQFDFPTARPAWARYEGRRTRGPAILNASRRQLDDAVDEHIDHHPPLIEAEVFDCTVDALAHETVRAVATEQKPRCQRPFATVGAIAYDRFDAVLVLSEVDERVAKQDVKRCGCAGSFAQDALELRLDEGERRRPGQREWRRHRLEFLDDLSVHAQKMRAPMRRCERLDPLRQPAALKEAHGFVIERQCARLIVDLVFGLRHRSPQTAMCEQIRQRRADRTEAHDECIIEHDASYDSVLLSAGTPPQQ